MQEWTRSRGQTEEESGDEDNEDDEGDDKDEDWVPPGDWKNTRQQECDRTNVEKENKKEEKNERIEEEEEVQKEENDNEGEGEEEEEDDTEEGEKEPESVDSDDNNVHKVLVPVNIEHEKRTENEKHESKDEKLNPVETVETRKSLDERETEELDPKNDIDASVELFTPDGGSKEADEKQSGRQKSASSIRKKGKLCVDRVWVFIFGTLFVF